jgi:hypothetical protein
MPPERTRIGVMLNGTAQFYQRDIEEKRRDGKFVAVPFFVSSRRPPRKPTSVISSTL